MTPNPQPPVNVPRFARDTVAKSTQQSYKDREKCFRHFNSAHPCLRIKYILFRIKYIMHIMCTSQK